MRATWSLFARFSRGLVIALTAVAVLEAVALAQQEVTFPDANLEAAIRGALNKPQGPVTDADLAGLTRLDAAYLYDIDDLTGLEHCIALQKLHLSGNQISDLTPLSGLTNLQELDLLGYQISDQDLVPLGSQISDLTPLSGLTELQRLLLCGHQISDLAPLAGMINLQELWLGDALLGMGNQIGDLTPLSGLTSLQTLGLDYNQIGDITPLSGLIGLQRLWLDYNQISDLTPLGGLTNLQGLFLWGNQISDLTPLSGLTSLQRLLLNHNQISDVSPLSGLTNLQTLGLETNPLDEAAYQLHIPALQAGGVDVSFDPPTAVLQAPEGPALPWGYALYPNAPNPFNPVTRIAYDLPQATHVALTIHNAARPPHRHAGLGYAAGRAAYGVMGRRKLCQRSLLLSP